MTSEGTALIPHNQSLQKAQPVFDEDSGTYICGKEIKKDFVCKAVPIAPKWKCRRHGGEYPFQKKMAASLLGIYSKKVWTKYATIQQELAANAEDVEALFNTDITDELGLTRVLLRELISIDEEELDMDRRDQIMQAIKLVSTIAKTSKEIQEKEQAALKREFMDAIITAIVHAFTRANSYNRPSDRARVFMSEFSNALPGVVEIHLPTDEEPVIEQQPRDQYEKHQEINRRAAKRQAERKRNGRTN